MELEKNNLNVEVKDFNSGSSETESSDDLEDAMDIAEIPNKQYNIAIFNFQYVYYLKTVNILHLNFTCNEIMHIVKEKSFFR